MLLEPQRRHLPVYQPRNGLIEDVLAEERERKRRNVWSEAEETLFAEKWLLYPKNFAKLATFFEWKSSFDCVQYYYLRKHKLDLKRSLHKHQKGRGRSCGYGTPRALSSASRQASAQPPPPPLKEVDETQFVTNAYRPGMRARARNFSYKEYRSPCILGSQLPALWGPDSLIAQRDASSAPRTGAASPEKKLHLEGAVRAR